MAVTVRITETYDMKTTVNKMGLVGIHTPTVALLRKMYPGLLKNYRYVRFVKCDVVGACASVLPADPLQIGVTAGTISPEDMFNPILYTAVTNSSFDTLVARVRNLTSVSPLLSVDAGNAWDESTGASSNFKTYYALLAENGKYKKVMPQSGFRINGLVPLAHTVISTFGNVGAIGNVTALADDGETAIPVPDMEVPEVTDTSAVGATKAEVFYRGKSIKMPRIAIHTMNENTDVIPNPYIPKTNVLALVLPPAKLHEFFYRMRVTWTIRFEQVCSSLEATNWSNWVGIADSSYGTNYTYVTSKSEMQSNEDMVSANDVEITKVMES